MTQIILNGLLLPQTDFDRYSCGESPLTRNVTMVSGRWVQERIGAKWKVWKVKWSYDCLEDEIARPLIDVLVSGGPFIASVLPNNQDELVTSTFVVESYTEPTFLIDDGNRPVWHGLAFTLREERPHA